MTYIKVYDNDEARLNRAAEKIGESVAQIIEWLVEENLDKLVAEEEKNNPK